MRDRQKGAVEREGRVYYSPVARAELHFTNGHIIKLRRICYRARPEEWEIVCLIFLSEATLQHQIRILTRINRFVRQDKHTAAAAQRDENCKKR